MYDIVIIGAGIAGLTAAIYGSRAGKSVLMLEGNIHGGQIINTLNIETFTFINMGFPLFKSILKIISKKKIIVPL